ncbi:thialysine N-epsilon-acetyltransferase-like [Oppia nitens]|uniref:thialysine N-epsilon-acetyltransferase-like n=1 Tax=Oppia nitens TaxID=1686743 RepID=UPI0023D9EEC7|nr:thialysine N-epsilon-acetyltransferase-like [Oppia nitens]
MSFTIRKGVKEDSSELRQLFRELAIYQNLDGNRVVEVQVIEKDGFGDQPECLQFQTFVAQHNDSQQLVGFALYYPKYSAWTGRGVWMEHLYVSPECRGTGIGRQLMAAVAKQALADGCARMEWDVFVWNTGAMSMYKKLGAIDLGESSEQTKVFRLFGQTLTQLAQGCQSQ